MQGDTPWPSLLRHSAINRKVAGSIRYGVRPQYGPGVESVPNKNDYQEYFLGRGSVVKAAGA